RGGDLGAHVTAPDVVVLHVRIPVEHHVLAGPEVPAVAVSRDRRADQLRRGDGRVDVADVQIRDPVFVDVAGDDHGVARDPRRPCVEQTLPGDGVAVPDV